MIAALNRGFRSAARNPAPFLLVLFVSLLFATLLDVWQPVAWALAAASVLALSQWFRVLWGRSQLIAVGLAAGFPALSIALAPAGRALSTALLFIPGILAVVLEGVSRRIGGLLPRLPPEPEASRRPRRILSPVQQGCRSVAMLFGLFFVGSILLFIWALRAPVVEANAFKGRIHRGMKLSDVAIVSFDTGRHLVFVRAEEGRPELRIGRSTAAVGEERAGSESEVRALLDRRAPELHVTSVSFMFLSIIPVRSSIVVNFTPDGKVTSVEGPFNWAS